jgi:hypothetical protein
MGFFSKVGKGLLGAGVGFLTGGPAGAVAGGVSGLLSGDSSARTSSQSSSYNNTSSQQTELRKWTGQEQQVVNQAYEGLRAGGQEVDKDEIYNQIFGLSSGAINDQYSRAGAQDQANRASRGASSGSTGDVRDDRRNAMQARELGDASSRAKLSAEEFALQAKADQRAAAQLQLAKLDSMWKQRLQGSKIIKTSSGTSTGESVAPDTFGASIAAGLGYAANSDQSYYNTNLSGNNNETPALWAGGRQGPIQ